MGVWDKLLQATMKTFLIFPACLLALIIAQKPILGQRDVVFKVQNCLGDTINVKLDMYANSCADKKQRVGMFGMPRGGFMTYGDPQPSCRVQRISANFAGRPRLGCSVSDYICNGNTKCNSFSVRFNPPAQGNETDIKSFCQIVAGNRC